MHKPLITSQLPSLPRAKQHRSFHMRRHSVEINENHSFILPTKGASKPFLDVSRKLSTKRASSLKPLNLPCPEFEWEFIIRLDSNYGDVNEINCSEIDLLDENRMPCKVVSIFPINETETDYSGPYSLLVSGDLNSDDTTTAWSHSWSMYPEPICIKIVVLSTTIPKFIRIWNVSFNSEANLKHFTVFYHTAFCCQGEVPQKFGVVWPISAESAEKLPNLELNLEKPYAKDQFGTIPLPFVKNITLSVLETYDQNANYAGLNCVEFFNTKGRLVPYSFIKSVVTSNGNDITSPYRVLKRRRRTSDVKEMWIAQKDGRLHLDFELNDPTQLILMRIWNFNGDNIEKFGIKKAEIFLDGVSKWKGKLHEGNQSAQVLFTSVTDIWFVDSTQYKDLPSINIINSTRQETDRSEELSVK